MKQIGDSKIYSLAEKGNIIKQFSELEVNDIMAGQLDYTEFFNNRNNSTWMLDQALKGRDKRIGFIEPPEFKENI